MKKFKQFLIFSIALTALLFSYRSAHAETTVFPKDERTHKIFKQEAIISEGNALVDRGFYDEAIVKFKEALDPLVLNEEKDKGRAIYYIRKVYLLQGKYEAALKELQWSINLNPRRTGWLDEKLELEALIKSRDTGSPEPVHRHIQYLKEKYKTQLPPIGYSAYSIHIISPLIRLYDHIADYDGGIAFIDELTAYYSKQKHGFDPTKRKYDADVIKIREAFEQDKAEGKKGRATRAIIQSDYFPW